MPIRDADSSVTKQLEVPAWPAVPESTPFVSVIIPIRNESEFIERSLGAAVEQDYPPARLEIIVADGRSTDGTREIVERVIRRQEGACIRLIDNPERILSTGFNRAFGQCRGDVVILLGGHAVIAHDYVRRCVKHLAESDAVCVGGHLETIAETTVGRTIALAMSSAFGVGGAAFRARPGTLREVDTVAFGAYRRAALEACGPFDEELVRDQDDEYNYRLRAHGGRILLAPDVRARYYSRSSLVSLWQQYLQYGYWKVRVMQRHPRQMQLRQYVPAAFIGALLGATGLSLFQATGRVALATVLVAYIVANAAASVAAARRGGWNHLVRLPVVFAALHLSYGVGFIAGLIRFGNRWREDRRGSLADRG